MSDQDPKGKWAALAQKELRDTPLSSLDRDYGGIGVKPVYFGEDSEIPGVEPFTRGVRATMYANRPWTIVKRSKRARRGSRSPSISRPIAAMTAITRASWAMSARRASPSTASRT